MKTANRLSESQVDLHLLQIVFEFMSKNLDMMESFWCFKIPQHNISVPFLLVGHTNDPQIAFERSHLNFGSLLIGGLIIWLSSHWWVNNLAVFSLVG